MLTSAEGLSTVGSTLQILLSSMGMATWWRANAAADLTRISSAPPVLWLSLSQASLFSPNGDTYCVHQEQQHKHKADSVGRNDRATVSAVLTRPSASSAIRTATAVLSKTQGAQWAIVIWTALLAHVGQLVCAVHGTLKAAVVWH